MKTPKILIALIVLLFVITTAAGMYFVHPLFCVLTFYIFANIAVMLDNVETPDNKL